MSCSCLSSSVADERKCSFELLFIAQPTVARATRKTQELTPSLCIMDSYTSSEVRIWALGLETLSYLFTFGWKIFMCIVAQCFNGCSGWCRVEPIIIERQRAFLHTAKIRDIGGYLSRSGWISNRRYSKASMLSQGPTFHCDLPAPQGISFVIVEIPCGNIQPASRLQ